MVAKEIMSREFETVLRGYKSDEVKEFQREISVNYSNLQKENEELEKKLVVLADKIREYREEEDMLKDALLGAQRHGNALIADAKRKSAEIIEEAQSKSDEMLKKANEDVRQLQVKSDRDSRAAEAKAISIINEANNKAIAIENEMNLKTDVQKEILHRVAHEVSEFKRRILHAYKLHTESVDRVAVDCENEFIKKTLSDKRPNLKTPEPIKNQNLKPYESRNQNLTPVSTSTPKAPAPASVAKSDENKAEGEKAKQFEINVKDTALDSGENNTPEKAPFFTAKGQPPQFKSNSNRPSELRFGVNNKDN